jgi:hypothetical protein
VPFTEFGPVLGEEVWRNIIPIALNYFLLNINITYY